jgi:putative Holliday junction resolvase
MRILGIDYGTKNVGVAISDDGAHFAFPKAVMKNDAKIFVGLAKIIEMENVSKIVLGDPGDNPIKDEVQKFAKVLETEFHLPVIMEKEFMTSVHVGQANGKKPIARLEKTIRGAKKDDSAAALILQRYLDRK